MNEEYYEARKEIYEILKKDLVGPVEPDEIISGELPIKTYCLGILYPQGISEYKDEDPERLEGKDDDNVGDDENIKLENIDRQSVIGISFNIKDGIHEILVKVEYAKYEREEKNVWRRIPKSWAKIVKVENGNKVKIEDELEVRITTYKIFSDDTRTATISLLNTNSSAKETNMTIINEKSFLQVKLEISSIDGSDIFIEKQIKINTIEDKELENLNLLYRNNTNLAIGNGTAVMWDHNKKQTDKIWTEVLPQYISNQMIPMTTETSKYREMQFLASCNKEELYDELKKLPIEYEKWLKIQSEDDEMSIREKDVLSQNIKKAEIVNKRIKNTIEMLHNNEDAFKAFQFMNDAMARQMKQKSKIENPKWYPFQIAFILLTLDGIIDEDNPNRDIVDLLWFPTGGGKTEAYLGVLAFTIFYRKIKQTKNGKLHIGTVVIMRYTLRLLTLQQFERAAKLICSCEIIRQENENTLGREEISIGLWVGENTETFIKDAKNKIRQYCEEKIRNNNNPCLIKRCPWCGNEIKPDQYEVEQNDRIGIKCGKCEVKGYLPIYLIDEEIYIRRPTLLISTVDKYARIPWLGQSGKLFGLDDENILPPELIIQDELHLIAGPLGTISGLYETIIDEYCSSKGIKPKIIASTATIRNADEQIKALYARKGNIFPTQIKDITDSFFAKEGKENQKASRMYIGTISTNISPVTLLVRVYAAIFYATRYLKEKGYTNEVVDSFWTEVGYFNSIRELGGAVVQIRNDVKDRYKYLCKRKFANIMSYEKMQKYYFDKMVEITSRNTGKTTIDEILHKLEVNYPEKAVQDYILATNMISVGIDINRLNLMLIDGQPKLNSEYIQASSRVGRKTPSIVIDLYNATKSRDKSHYEQFVTYHSNIYKYVEATSVTPFSCAAREKALHAVLISLVRQFIPEMNEEYGASKIKEKKEDIYLIAEKILKRVAIVDEEEFIKTKEDINSIIEYWDEISDGMNLTYTKSNSKKLLIRTDETSNNTIGFVTLNSMRNVDTTSNVFIIE